MRRRHRLLVAAGLLAPACSPAPTAHRSTTSSANPPAEAGPDVTAASTVTTSAGAAPISAGAASTPAPADPTTTLRVTTTSTVVLAPAVVLTVPLPEDEGDDLTDEEWWEAQPGYQPSTRDALLACIRSFEQNDNPKAGPTGYASDTGNGYYGAYQFDLGTWRSVGGSGNPAHASPAEQDARAWTLYLRRGLAPWPTPARRCR